MLTKATLGRTVEVLVAKVFLLRVRESVRPPVTVPALEPYCECRKWSRCVAS